MSDRWVDELMPDQPMWVRDLVDEELTRKGAEVERLTTLLKHTVPRLITVLRMPNIEHVADAHNEAVVTLRAALAGKEGQDG